MDWEGAEYKSSRCGKTLAYIGRVRGNGFPASKDNRLTTVVQLFGILSFRSPMFNLFLIKYNLFILNKSLVLLLSLHTHEITLYHLNKSYILNYFSQNLILYFNSLSFSSYKNIYLYFENMKTWDPS